MAKARVTHARFGCDGDSSEVTQHLLTICLRDAEPLTIKLTGRGAQH
jgi:hypothetical protein